jgi:hypothetical protein
MGKKWLAFAFMVLMLTASLVSATTYVNLWDEIEFAIEFDTSASAPTYFNMYHRAYSPDLGGTAWSNAYMVMALDYANRDSDRFPDFIFYFSNIYEFNWIIRTGNSGHDLDVGSSIYDGYQPVTDRVYDPTYMVMALDYANRDSDRFPDFIFYFSNIYIEDLDNDGVIDPSDFEMEPIFWIKHEAQVYIDVNNPELVEITFTFVDNDGDPVSIDQFEDMKVWIDLGTIVDNIGTALLYQSLKDMWKEGVYAPTNKLRLYFYDGGAATTKTDILKMPKYVYYGLLDNWGAYTYTFQVQPEVTINGQTYYLEPKAVDTTNGDVTLTFVITGYDAPTQPAGEQYIYISFYEDESKQAGVYLPNYNISVVKANTPDGLSFPTTHTYELYNYYTLKIPVDTNYPYVVVTLTDSLGNVVFKKGYVMQSGVYEEYLTGAKKLVNIKVYDTATGTYLNDFTVTMKGSTTDYIVNAVNGTVSVAVVPDTYIVEVDHNGNIIYSTVLDVYQTVDTTFFVNANWTGVVKFKFVDSSLNPVNVQDVVDSFNIKLTSSAFSFELPNLNTVYSQDPSYTNNVMYYYIRNNEELTAWQNEGFYLKLLDKQTGIEARKYFLKMDSNPDEFMVILPIVSMPGETEPYVLPPEQEEITDEQRDQMTRQTTTAVFDYLFAKGLLVVIIAVAIAVELGGGLGLFVGLALILAFTWMGMVPRTFGALASLGFGAGLMLMFRGSGGREG